MRPELNLERKIWLLRHPGVVHSISRAAMVSESLVYQVLRGAKRSARVAAALEAAGATSQFGSTSFLVPGQFRQSPQYGAGRSGACAASCQNLVQHGVLAFVFRPLLDLLGDACRWLLSELSPLKPQQERLLDRIRDRDGARNLLYHGRVDHDAGLLASFFVHVSAVYRQTVSRVLTANTAKRYSQHMRFTAEPSQ